MDLLQKLKRYVLQLFCWVFPEILYSIFIHVDTLGTIRHTGSRGQMEEQLLPKPAVASKFPLGLSLNWTDSLLGISQHGSYQGPKVQDWLPLESKKSVHELNLFLNGGRCKVQPLVISIDGMPHISQTVIPPPPNLLLMWEILKFSWGLSLCCTHVSSLWPHGL